MASVAAAPDGDVVEPLAPPAEPLPERVYRHRLPVRLWHWVNAVALIGLFMSGLMIFNAHPRLYWGHYGANATGAPDPAWLQISTNAAGEGIVHVPGVNVTLVTDGVLGRASDAEGVSRNRAFPHWITLPGTYDLAAARAWHFFFAWFFAFGLLGFMAWAFIARHASRDLAPSLKELSPAHLWHEVKDHARLRFPTGLAAARFNSLQRISYFAVIFLMLPVMIFSGLAMAPAMDASWPFVVDMFGGRQSARSVHFITCWLLFGFFLVHLAMVILAGPVNELRSMINGWFKLPPERAQGDEA